MKKTVSAFIWLMMWLASTGFANKLPASEIFQLSIAVKDPNAISLNWQIKPGHFLYKDRIQIINDGNHAEIGQLSWPLAITFTDGLKHTHPVYQHALKLTVPILGINAGESILTVQYQGCSTDGFCYPPQSKQVKLIIDNTLSLKNASILKSNDTKNPNTYQSDDELENWLFNHHWTIALISFFGFGLLLTFTPCILPMLPVLSGIIVGHGKDLSTRKAFLLSLSYVMGMALTYALIGAVIAKLGENLQIIMQAPTAVLLLAVIFVLLATSMFGLFELKLPTSWQAKIASLTRSQSSGHYAGAAVMGSLSTLILSPCVTAPLIGALAYIAHTGNTVFGTLALFCLALGMGAPLLLIGTSAGAYLPKAGAWMNTIKGGFGFALLGLAIYLLDRILPAPVTMTLWSILLIQIAIFLDVFSHRESCFEKILQGLGVFILIYSIVIFIGGQIGGQSPIRPLATVNLQGDFLKIPQKKVYTTTTLPEIKKTIQAAGSQPVVIDFYADWCATCKTIEKTILNQKPIQDILSQFTFIRADVTKNNQDSSQMMQKFKVIAPPTLILKQCNDGKTRRLAGDFSAQSLEQDLKNCLNLG